MRPWGTETAIPGRQIAEIKVSRPAFRMDVTTADGRRLMLRWWFGRGPQFTALRDAVMTSVAAMG